jgi:hypothetical protein
LLADELGAERAFCLADLLLPACRAVPKKGHFLLCSVHARSVFPAKMSCFQKETGKKLATNSERMSN